MPPLIVTYNSLVELFERLVNRPTLRKTHVIVCSTKEEFLDQLVPLLLENGSPKDPEIPASQDSDREIEDINTTPSEHAFFSPTLRLIGRTENIKLSFCPHISTLRAHLSRFLFTRSESYSSSTINHTDDVVILNMIALHHDTSEFTLQGITRSLAAAVSTAHRCQWNLSLVECADVHDPSNTDRGSSLWNAQVPLLSGSVKLGEEGSKWAGRTISIRTIASRWFKFVENRSNTGLKADRRQGHEADEEEMVV